MTQVRRTTTSRRKYSGQKDGFPCSEGPAAKLASRLSWDTRDDQNLGTAHATQLQQTSIKQRIAFNLFDLLSLGGALSSGDKMLKTGGWLPNLDNKKPP